VAKEHLELAADNFAQWLVVDLAAAWVADVGLALVVDCSEVMADASLALVVAASEVEASAVEALAVV
jgi:hypothetical protein